MEKLSNNLAVFCVDGKCRYQDRIVVYVPSVGSLVSVFASVLLLVDS